jgi:ParB-like chromosome segregation protein Spo0J
MKPVLAAKIEHWPVERLIPYARNARTHSEAQIAQIAASIQEFGFNVPILVEPGAGILAGHGRLMGAQKLGLPEVPVIVLEHLTETQRRAYILADNKLALNAGWDMAMLTDELAQLAEQISVELMGFDAAEFEAMLKKLEPPDEFPEYDENVETQHECPKCGYRWSGQPS